MLITKSPQTPKFDRYFLMFDACAVLFMVLIVAEIAGYDHWLVSLLAVIWAVLLLSLFSRKRRDEFAEHCWQRATSATFVMLIIAPLALGFGAGIIDGFTGAQKNPSTVGTEPLVIILFATFYGVFEWTRFRGGR
jgi:uncharacterized membrane protein YfcA